MLRHQAAVQGICDQGAGVGNAIDGRERAEARSLILAEQHLIDRFPPFAGDAGAFWRGVLGGQVLVARNRARDIQRKLLDGLRAGAFRHICQGRLKPRKCLVLDLVSGAVVLLRAHEIAEISDGVADERIELRVGRRRHIRRIALEEGPEYRLVLGIGHGHQIEQKAERDLRARSVVTFAAGLRQHLRRWRFTGMNVPGGVAKTVLPVLLAIAVDGLLIVIDRARDDIKMQLLGFPRTGIHEQRQAFGRAIAQPLVNGQAVALGLGDLLALFIEKQLVVEAVRRNGAQRPRDLAGELDGIDQILARHLVIDTQRHPAHGPIRLPLQLAMAARHRCLEALA